jgi:hypothetical protein
MESRDNNLFYFKRLRLIGEGNAGLVGEKDFLVVGLGGGNRSLSISAFFASSKVLIATLKQATFLDTICP